MPGLREYVGGQARRVEVRAVPSHVLQESLPVQQHLQGGGGPPFTPRGTGARCRVPTFPTGAPAAPSR
eukprot:2699257-Lingulodinium_polyedra.AAC.1